MFSAVAKVADVISTVVPGPIGTALSLVSAGAYLASGNKSAAAWALAGAAAAFIPGGKLALKATRAVVGAGTSGRQGCPLRRQGRQIRGQGRAEALAR